MIEQWGRETHPLMLVRRRATTDMIGLSLCNFEEEGGHLCLSVAQASQGGFGDYPPANFVLTRLDDPYVVKPEGIYYAIPDMCVRPNDCKDRIKWKSTGSAKKLFPEEYIVRPNPGQPHVTVTVHGKTERVDYGAITSAYMVRASLVARVADGRDGIVMVWPKVAEAGAGRRAGSSIWSLLIIRPQDPGTKPIVKEIECPAPKGFTRDPAVDAATQSPFTLMRSALLAARGPDEKQDAIVAVRRAIGPDGSPTLLFGGVAPTSNGYRTIGGDACVDSAVTWDAEIPTYPAVTTLSSKQ
jgi:hypothetical protein